MGKEFMKIGIDYNDLLLRINNNETIAVKFLKKFIEDQTMMLIEEDYRSQDYEQLLKDVHSLKGISANLSMKKLFTITSCWVSDLRAEKYQTSEELYQQCLEEYTKIILGLKEIFNNE
ncbi:MAG: Hpt domain-containing protein [Longibaculum sp.]